MFSVLEVRSYVTPVTNIEKVYGDAMPRYKANICSLSWFVAANQPHQVVAPFPVLSPPHFLILICAFVSAIVCRLPYIPRAVITCTLRPKIHYENYDFPKSAEYF